jgi:hypothetical protein
MLEATMAKINDKDITDLSTWTMKELRKLKINSKNRISALQVNPKSSLGKNHILFDMEAGELEELVLKVHRAEKVLANK